MAKIEVEIKLSKKLQYELTRIKKDVANVRRYNAVLKKENDKLIRSIVNIEKELVKKNGENLDLKFRVKTLLESCKPKKEILVEITTEQASMLKKHCNCEVFILNDDNSETRIIDTFYGNNYFWQNHRFAIEAKPIPEVKS
jgi:vacuolar-type H+-ATPase subunit D/Vma8